MRTPHFAGSLALLLLLALPAAAQMPSPIYAVEILDRPAGSIVPGSVATFNLTATRTCSNSVEMLDPAAVQVKVASDANLTVTGPGQVQFPSQFCAREPQMTVAFEVSVHVAADAAAHAHVVSVHLWPQSQGALPRHSQEATTDFAVPVAAPEPKVVPESVAKEAPGAAPIFLLAALGVAALVARRSE